MNSREQPAKLVNPKNPLILCIIYPWLKQRQRHSIYWHWRLWG